MESNYIYDVRELADGTTLIIMFITMLFIFLHAVYGNE